MSKPDLRERMKKRRASLPESVRLKASWALWEKTHALSGLTLSYASFGSELCTMQINRLFAAKGTLVLPRRSEESLRLFRMNRMPSYNPSNLFEPDPKSCEEVFLHQLSRIFVPALAFDQAGFRLGYGKGHYDRLLKDLPPHIPSIGIGFQQQLLCALSIESHDIPVQQIWLF
jgi:5-formyltetrahydrofolate cyclo-ligase